MEIKTKIFLLSRLELPVVTREWLTKCFELKKKVSMQSYAVGASKCEDDEENVNEQNVNSGIGANEPTQKFEKRMEDGTICNLNDGNEHVVNGKLSDMQMLRKK